jgi:hypothetical protein
MSDQFIKSIRQLLKQNNTKLRTHYDSEFWQLVRKQAESKLKAATRPNGTLIWDKLPNLLTTNPKVEKSPDTDEKYLVQILHLAPSFASLFNTCSKATLGCGTNCLNESGHGQKHMMHKGTHSVHVARVIRTLIWFRYRDQFKAKFQRELDSQRVKAHRLGATPVVRPNGTSDLRFESLWPELFNDNPDVVFYDYTKDIGRNVSHIPNYSLCYSVSEESTNMSIELAFSNSMNCVVVGRLKRNDSKPESYMGRTAIDGDSHDLRFLDPKGVFVILFAKGHAYNDTSGFVRDMEKESV